MIYYIVSKVGYAVGYTVCKKIIIDPMASYIYNNYVKNTCVEVYQEYKRRLKRRLYRDQD